MSKSIDIAVIILTYNEELHIRRCLENVRQFSDEIFVIDCFSTDRTAEIAESLGAKVFQHKWENNYARQFNWALDNCPIKSEWILRLDADEYFLPEAVEEVKQKLPSLPAEVSGVVFKRRQYFLGKWMKRGIYPVKLLRLFRRGKGRCEVRWMDEHIQISEGASVEFKCDFVDHNLNDISWWTQKHVNYAVREAADLLMLEHEETCLSDRPDQLNAQAASKRRKKHRYGKLPLFWRSFAYFLYRYFLKLGFLDGKEGFLWHFLQGWWYRTFVDAKIFELQKRCGNDSQKIKQYLAEKYHIQL